MRILLTTFGIVFLLPLHAIGIADDAPPADALATEPVKIAISDLDHPDAGRRENVTELLSNFGVNAIPSVVDAAELGSIEASTRAFEILHRMLRTDDESIQERVERGLRRLKKSQKLDVGARAQRVIDSNSEIRQKRAIAHFERLGGVINYKSSDYAEQHSRGRPTIEYYRIDRKWQGGEEGLELLTRIEELHQQQSPPLYVIKDPIRGIPISQESLNLLSAELPFLKIETRGPARLGVRNNPTGVDSEGCEVGVVDPGSAADNAGIRQYDHILKIDGHPVRSFKDLVEIISEKEPGDRVPILFLRGNELKKTVAELLPW